MDTNDNVFQVERIKERVEEKEGIPPPQQRLIFSGKQMNDEKTAADYKVRNTFYTQRVSRSSPDVTQSQLFLKQ